LYITGAQESGGGNNNQQVQQNQLIHPVDSLTNVSVQHRSTLQRSASTEPHISDLIDKPDNNTIDESLDDSLSNGELVNPKKRIQNALRTIEMNRQQYLLVCIVIVS
jgi:hypothetical protein